MRLKRRLRSDEINSTRLLDRQGSVSCGISRQLSQFRDIAKQVLRSVRFLRDYQTTFCNIVCGRRFRFYDDDGSLLPTLRPLWRGSPDSLGHLLLRTDLEIIPRTRDDLVEFLSTLVIRSCRGNSGFPRPIFLLAAEHLEFPGATGSGGEISSSVATCDSAND